MRRISTINRTALAGRCRYSSGCIDGKSPPKKGGGHLRLVADLPASEEWGRILGDEVMAAALLDRLLHRCHIVNIRGNSYRVRRHADLSKAIHPGGARDISPPPETAS